MSRRLVLSIAVAVVCLGAATLIVWDGGVSGQETALAGSIAAMEALRFAPLGEADVRFEVDQMMAWALERSRPGSAGRQLPLGEGGAVRYRMRWPGGGEAVVTAGGVVWVARRPVPTDPGPDLYPAAARDTAAGVLAGLVPGADQYRVARAQSFNESGHVWHRMAWTGDAGPLPLGWEREVEVEIAGSAVVGVVRRVRPLGTDLGVVASRSAELRLLRTVAITTLALVVAGILLATAEGLVFHERLVPARGLGLGGVVFALETASGVGTGPALLVAAVAAATFTAMPVWTSLAKSRASWGVPVGVATAVVVSLAPALVRGVGGWMPESATLEVETSPVRLAAQSWRTALVEEPLLRGALPGIAAPLFGWWGGALIGIFAGALLHPLPAVPLVATIAVQGLIQLGMVIAARKAGVGAAVAARGICELILRRAAYPAGIWWSLVAVVPIAVGVILLCWKREGD